MKLKSATNNFTLKQFCHNNYRDLTVCPGICRSPRSKTTNWVVCHV